MALSFLSLIMHVCTYKRLNLIYRLNSMRIANKIILINFGTLLMCLINCIIVIFTSMHYTRLTFTDDYKTIFGLFK